MKKLLVFLLTLTMLLAVSVCPAFASEGQISYFGTISVNPGNVRAENPVYNYAWLDNMIIRDDPMAALQAKITPKPDYPYSHTYDEFIEESKNYSMLLTIDENTVAAGYDEIVNAMYYVVVAMGMTTELDIMCEYLTEQGIRLPANSAASKAEIAVVYAAIKYDAVYALYGKHVTFTKGTSLDGAVVTIMSALTGTVVPSGVDSLTGYGIHCTKTYVTAFSDLPISSDPSTEEIFYWAKVISAASNDYQVPVEVYELTTPAQKQYVDYAYYASILTTVYDVQINPVKLVVAMQSSDSLALQKLILYSMLDESGVDYAMDMSCQKLFDMACQNGWFALENEFYTDIMKYEIEVAQECTKIWFTPFPLAGVLSGSSEEYLSLRLAGSSVAPSSTTGVTLDPSKSQEIVYLECNYNSPERNDSAVYEFVIKKNAALNGENNSSSENDMIASVEQYVNSIVPSENEAAGAVIDGVFQSVDSALQNNTTAQVGEGILTTYADTQNTPTYGSSEGLAGSGDRFDFDYLEELIDGVYATDADGNIVTSPTFTYGEQTTEQTFIDKTVETVKENPEIVVAPTGVIAVGAFMGYLMSKKHRDSEAYLEETEDSKTEE
ncbi:MAG: hypothetical protein IJC79_00655 [Clostridia bacterium]|nr:hypothetical protein [Clostridia bacterium]